MLKGMYIAASGMRYQMDALNEVANNLANVNTSGYKRGQLVAQSFDNLVYQFTQPTPNNQAGAGVIEAGKARIESEGNMIRTANPLNVAIAGNGYFQVQSPTGAVKVTRDGDFRLDNEGYLATQGGDRVLADNNQPILLRTVGPQPIRVLEDGTLQSGNQTLGRLKLVDNAAANPATYPASNLGVPAVNTGYKLQQGYLESSNVSVVNEMVNMITINRAFSFGQKAITTQDNLLQKSVNDLGKVQ